MPKDRDGFTTAESIVFSVLIDEQPRSLDELRREITQRYGVAFSLTAGQLQAILAGLQARGYISTHVEQ